MKKLFPAGFIALSILILLPLANLASVLESDDLPWLDGFTLVVLETSDVPSMHRAVKTIQASGGKIAIMSPPSILMGWIPIEIRSELIGRSGIKDIFYTDVELDEVRASDRQSRMMVEYFNRAVRREVQLKHQDWMRQAAGDDKQIMKPDALERPEFNEADYLQNLRDVGLDIQQLKNEGNLLLKSEQAAAYDGNKMTGTVAVTIFYVESDGSGSDPNLYT